MIKTNSVVSSYVDPAKVLEWEFKTPENEGIISIQQMYEEANSIKYNWLLFYAWCYVRTGFFRSAGMKNWDYGNLGFAYKSSRDGIKDALSEFIKHEDTSTMPEKEDVERIYLFIDSFCMDLVWKEPKPLPKPDPAPVPKPEEPKPEEPKPEEPTGTQKSFPWLKILVPLIAGGLAIASLFVPGWAKILLDVILKIVNGLG